MPLEHVSPDASNKAILLAGEVSYSELSPGLDQHILV